MAKKVSNKSAIPNWKKKKWLELVAPAIYGDKVVGESLVENPDDLIGKVVTVNLMHVVGSPRKQNFSVKLRVEKIHGKQGITKPISIAMLASSVRRLIKAGKDRVDMSFTAKSKDGVVLRFKPFFITKSKTVNSVLTDLNSKAKEFVTEYALNNDYEAIFDAVTRSALQRDLKAVLDKVFPLKMVEIRVLEVELKSGVRSLPDFVVDLKPKDVKIEESESTVIEEDKDEKEEKEEE